MDEIRCGACSRKLGEGEYVSLQIKCPRCGTLNSLRAGPSPEQERRRASKKEASTHARKTKTS
ncbi:MAG: Com family DNA-binding transcriptional regulator [Desulfuromonadales bacterium]|nr:Com family DNA-binding transcriptional regulator [Desulfuromonadales bacterium]